MILRPIIYRLLIDFQYFLLHALSLADRSPRCSTISGSLQSNRPRQNSCQTAQGLRTPHLLLLVCPLQQVLAFGKNAIFLTRI